MAELFANFEVNRDRRRPRVLVRTLTGSLALHALFVALVVYVPTVRGMLHLAGMFGDAEYVEEEYELAQIRERATMIRLSGDKLYYPPGYFSNNPYAKPAPEPEPR